MSTTEEELQRNISRIHDYCKMWFLTINIDKTKVMNFSKSGCVPKDKFRFVIGADDIEYVKQYKYLGVVFTSNAKFSVAEKTLSMKASRASFAIICYYSILNKKVQVGKDQEKAQSEKDSHSKNRGGKKTN